MRNMQGALLGIHHAIRMDNPAHYLLGVLITDMM